MTKMVKVIMICKHCNNQIDGEAEISAVLFKCPHCGKQDEVLMKEL